MTDLADNLGPTLACQSCGAEVAIEIAVRNGFDCPDCGASLPERPDYAIEGATTALEVVRAYGAYGYADDYTIGGDDRVVCPGCAADLSFDEVAVDARRDVEAQAGPSDETEQVMALRCPRCGTAGTIVISTGGGEVRATA
jgi:predicted RNA-binding Zn-ribbon protein involved in translation (DUF1610 family)